MFTNDVQEGVIMDSSVKLPPPQLVVNGFAEGNSHVLRVAGELDMATRPQVVAAAAATDHASVVIDLAGVTFMDCSGFACIEATRQAIETAGRTLTVRGATGQPAKLFELIAELDRIKPPAPPART